MNDTLGHSAGDALLRELAHRFRAVLREGDLIARLGGDEFIVVTPLPGTTEDLGPHGAAVAETLRDRLVAVLDEPFLLSGRKLTLSASAGVSLFPEDGTDPRTLIRSADSAMYHDKWARSGRRSRIKGSSGFDEQPLVESMSAGLERSADLGAWSLAFQPIVELALGRTIGAEALLRWPDSTYGDVGPAGFLPVAEELGLSVSIGDWVLGGASPALRRVARGGCARRPADADLQRFAEGAVAPKLPRPGRRAVRRDRTAGPLIAEISEVALAMTPMKAKEVLIELRAAGVRVAIDAFGTGPSSLELLRELPVDIVKLDRGLVSGIDLDERARRSSAT